MLDAKSRAVLSVVSKYHGEQVISHMVTPVCRKCSEPQAQGPPIMSQYPQLTVCTGVPCARVCRTAVTWPDYYN